MTELTEDTTDDVSSYWGKDEFEDLVARAMIACYEQKLVLPEAVYEPGYRMVPMPGVQPKPTDMNIIRKYGPYFSPGDRVYVEGCYWWDLDGLPQYAVSAMVDNKQYKKQRCEDLIGLGSYLDIYLVEKINKFPIGVLMPPLQRYIAKYRMAMMYAMDNHIEGINTYFGIKNNGDVISQITDDHSGMFDNGVMCAAVLHAHADRRHLWNVMATESEAKAQFGVYEEQIKSLFYARSLPLTTTGRKRPILHWVNAHRRRMNAGIDIDIRKHLRGIEEFEMKGTNFCITRPVKSPMARRT